MALFSQVSLTSVEEDYFNFLQLKGELVKPTLGYKTLSDNKWDLSGLEENEEHIWKNNNLGTVKNLLNSKIQMKIYGPEWFNSVNTTSPFGQNDGALWQGRGYNTSLTGGLRLESYGFELTFKPQITFNQNLNYSYLKPEGFEDSIYDGKAKDYGYFWGSYCDVPQRFGDKPFFTFDFGDSEIRYSWKNLTVGFGTEAIWLGPAKINPVLQSNNAPTYPKIDIGLRKQEVYFPKWDWSAGTVEARIWTGLLTESDYFDNNPDNNHNLIHGLSLSYAPSFLQGLVINANRVCLVKAEWKNMYYIIPIAENTHVGEKDAGEDQKMSLTFDWFLPKSKAEVYAEIGLDDFIASGNRFFGYVRYPFHTMAYTIGLRQAFDFKKNPDLKGELLFEWNSTEMSQDFQMQWAYNFGFHYQIIHGFSNKGQWMGSGIGYGGNSQLFRYRLYYPKGSTTFTLSRNNPDNNYIYSKCVDYAVDGEYKIRKRWFSAFKANLFTGVDSQYYVTRDLSLDGGLYYNLIVNPLYNPTIKGDNGYYRQDSFAHNVYFKMGAKYFF